MGDSIETDALSVAEEKLNEDEILTKIRANGLVLDESREAIVRHIVKAICSRRRCSTTIGQNRIGRLILGRKSVGKSTLLHEVGNALDAHSFIRVVKFDCLACDTMPPLVEQVLHVVTNPNGNTKVPEGEGAMVDRIASVLHESNDVAVVLVDELQVVYGNARPREAATRVLSNLHFLSGHVSGRFVCVVTGSSEYLRRLAFAKMDPTEAQETGFVHYSRGLDLNTTKLQPRWIQPLLDRMSFTELVMKMCETGAIDVAPTEEDILKLYVRSGAVPGLVWEAFDEGQDTWSTSAKGLQLQEGLGSVLAGVIQAMGEPPHADEPSIEHEWKKVEWKTSFVRETFVFVWLSDNSSEDWRFDKEEFVAAIYNLADRGLLRMSFGDGERQISLGTPRVYDMLTTHHGVNGFSMFDLLVLRVPNHPLCEAVALRGIACAAPQWLGLPLSHQHAIEVLDVRSKIDDIPNRLWKCGDAKGNDSLGTDGVIFVRDGNSVLVHCIQLKLGRGPMIPRMVEKIVERLTSMETTRRELYDKHWHDLKFSFQYHLITTKDVFGDGERILSNNDVTCWKRKVFPWPSVFSREAPNIFASAVEPDQEGKKSS